MKHSIDDGGLPTNLLLAFQKNKIMQGKLTERQRNYYVQLLKDMQDYQLKEKLNRELLYTWKKETYVRQLKKNLQEYERKRFGVRDAYYEYQARNLDCIMAGQQGLVIPPTEEERRVNVNAKYLQFLEQNPLDKPSSAAASLRQAQSSTAPADHTKREQEEAEARAVEKTWTSIHAQSAVGLRRRPQQAALPSIQRSSTMDEIRRNQALAKTLVPPTVAIISSVLVTTTPEMVAVPAAVAHDEKILPASRFASIRPTLPEGVEPVLITSETLQKQTRSDLVAMRSVRRPRKNPIDLNMAFEARKRIYQINKRVYDYPFCPRKCALQYTGTFERGEASEAADEAENQLLEMNENTRRRYEDRHQADRSVV